MQSGLAVIIVICISSPVGEICTSGGEKEGQGRVPQSGYCRHTCQHLTGDGSLWRCPSSPSPQRDLFSLLLGEAIQITVIICIHSKPERAGDKQLPQNIPATTLARKGHSSWNSQPFPESLQMQHSLAAMIKALSQLPLETTLLGIWFWLSKRFQFKTLHIKSKP